MMTLIRIFVLIAMILNLCYDFSAILLFLLIVNFIATMILVFVVDKRNRSFKAAADGFYKVQNSFRLLNYFHSEEVKKTVSDEKNSGNTGNIFKKSN